MLGKFRTYLAPLFSEPAGPAARGSLELLRERAERGDATVQFSLGNRYFYGQGVSQDYAEAARWFSKASAQGNFFAQVKLGIMCQEGFGVPQDCAKAANWYRKAAAQGFAAAQWGLGSLYEKGDGVPKDFVQAHIWLNLALSRGFGGDDEYFAEALDRVASKLSQRRLAEAQQLAREWKPVEKSQQ